MSASPDSAVVCRGVGKRFDDWVFRSVDLALPAKRTSAIVGESGCGKTTLLQLVNAVLRPDEGSVEVLGDAVVHGHRSRSIPPTRSVTPSRAPGCFPI